MMNFGGFGVAVYFCMCKTQKMKTHEKQTFIFVLFARLRF